MKWERWKQVETKSSGSSSLSREQILLLAVIDQALQDAFSTKITGQESIRIYPHLKARLADEAYRWLASDEEMPPSRVQPARFTFLWCCQQLGMRPQVCIRSYLKQNKSLVGVRQ